MAGGQQEARVAAVDGLRVQANQVMLGNRTHIEVAHLDALRIVDLVRSLTEDRDELRRTNKQLWERMGILEAHIERLGSSVDAAFTEAASAIEAAAADETAKTGSTVGESAAPSGETPTPNRHSQVTK